MARRYWAVFINPVALIFALPMLALMLGALIFAGYFTCSFLIPKNVESAVQATLPRPSAACPVRHDFSGEIIRVVDGRSVEARCPGGQSVLVFLYGCGEPKGDPGRIQSSILRLSDLMKGKRAEFHLRGWDAEGRLYADARLPNGRSLNLAVAMTGVFPYQAPAIKEMAMPQ